MIQQNDKNADLFQRPHTNTVLEKLPVEVKAWAESLPWNQRRYVLSLSYILCATTPDLQAEFLDDYTADGLVSKMFEDVDTLHRVKEYLIRFQVKKELNESDLRSYIKQFYIHSAQQARRETDQYLESALRFVLSTEERNNVFNYILGFEFIKIVFQMSWLQHERLARLQKSQSQFIESYIKPIQHAHRINGIIVPKDERIFFARRTYYIQQPNISYRKLIELVMASFTTEMVTQCGFSISRHSQAFQFDYDYIYDPEPEEERFPTDLQFIH
ncbi:cobyrinic acid a,c-diamide synthase [Microcoleus sp.]|uniref:cobyrinic acid a,c-diamide synthase n=1 Tax=Microcoleus sp. TaxID=44472 RepID=UPI0035938521